MVKLEYAQVVRKKLHDLKFFYKLKNETTVMILEMLHEKEDFMQKLFGIKTVTKESEDYWDE